ncbi:TPA_asm: plasmid-related protein [Listeria monocytogenes]|nr:plasmid-related protein [Listeria monocytogenes]
MSLSKLKKRRTKYQLFAGIIVSVFVVFFVISVFSPDYSTVKHSKIGTEINLSNRTVTLIDEAFYEDKNVVELNFYTTIPDASTAKNITVNVTEGTKGNENLSVATKKINESLYVVFVENLPKKWKTLKVKVSEKGVGAEEFDMVDPFYVANEKVKHKEHFQAKSVTYYEAKEINLFIQDAEKTIAKNNKEGKKLADSNIKIAEVNRDIQANLSYQTEAKKQEMKAEIQSNEQKIVSQKETMQNLDKANEELEKAIEKAKKQKKLLEWL